jgi:hypothetical protein
VINSPRRLAVVASLLLLGIGCGGTSKSAGGIAVQTGSLTKASFKKQADEICEESRARFLHAFLQATQQGKRRVSLAERADQFTHLTEEDLVPIYERAIDRISSLGVPSDEEKGVVAFLETLRRELRKAGDHPMAALESLTPFPQASELAKVAGLPGCATSLD